MSDVDPYVWLESLDGADGEKALQWVRARNEETIGRLAGGERFGRLRDGLRAVLDSDARIPWPVRRGRYLYNFWQDAGNPRGLWRRTTLDGYRAEEPDWEILLDVDALAREEGENWVWEGASLLYPDYRLGLVHLSRGGADAAVVREFDVRRRAFVEDGFVLPEAKSRVSWIDADRVYLGTDFGPGSLTESGYPRTVREWRRGTPPEEAVTVFEGAAEDVAVSAYHDPMPGHERDLVYQTLDFYRSRRYLRSPEDGVLTLLDLPEDAGIGLRREWLLVRPRSAWRVGGREHPAGALLAIRFEEFAAGGREFAVLFEPDAHTSLRDWAWTRNHLLLTVLADVRTELRLLTPPAGEGAWDCARLPAPEAMASVEVLDTSPLEDDEYLTVTSGFLTPPTLGRGVAGRPGEPGAPGEPVEPLKRAPAFFDAEGMTVEQHFAESEDGTRIPYFLVRPAGAGAAAPTLLNGYGGFEASKTPAYNALVGRGWLERGGCYAVANIRGGGEYGPEWHAQAVKSGRHKVYEDFAAVAADLVRRGVTAPARLAIEGGSNGGLLMGVMLTRYPELFGAIAAQVPLLDMRRYHRLLAGASWMAEYGDPDDPADWSFIGEYSPYQRVRADGDYPPLLLTSSTRDDRVHPGHARKMAARMLAWGHDVHYYENVEGGHGGASNNEQAAFVRALVLDFLWNRTTRPAR
ncbi:prolyl oligopeptidase family serine peptidase [Phaeacidiphilus oryzae]|uniref:prolyl oligopeptidase family serine peptidase n=1 Tax=Phaeacidiphilus oryzae TaxID=348818 RepID=UPI00056C706E|nr:prolyl oligopeptidase family serine peptidase [Phaeacidiphilus oryzae]